MPDLRSCGYWKAVLATVGGQNWTRSDARLLGGRLPVWVIRDRVEPAASPAMSATPPKAEVTRHSGRAPIPRRFWLSVAAAPSASIRNDGVRGSNPSFLPPLTHRKGIAPR
jgi:hypothetical protein